LTASFRDDPKNHTLTPPAIESQSLETGRQVAAIIAGDVPPGAANADHWRRPPAESSR
jgi:hypothetical protein